MDAFVGSAMSIDQTAGRITILALSSFPYGRGATLAKIAPHNVFRRGDSPKFQLKKVCALHAH